jgi:hypothetical protein
MGPRRIAHRQVRLLEEATAGVEYLLEERMLLLLKLTVHFGRGDVIVMVSLAMGQQRIDHRPLQQQEVIQIGALRAQETFIPLPLKLMALFGLGELIVGVNLATGQRHFARLQERSQAVVQRGASRAQETVIPLPLKLTARCGHGELIVKADLATEQRRVACRQFLRSQVLPLGLKYRLEWNIP